MNLPDDKKMCHCTGFTKKCKALVVNKKCQDRWVTIQGAHPQTNEPMTKSGCVDDVMVWLQIENSKLLNENGASIDGMRNAFVKLAKEAAARQNINGSKTVVLENEDHASNNH